MENVSEKKDIWNYFYYFIIYSIIGFFMETFFALVTKGVIESRQSFLYGPFCMIYGVGAIAMIIILRNERRIPALFFGGLVIGGIVEYYSSLICEIMFGVKWWDYSNMLLNIHGRTCLFYLVSWGILGIILIKYVNPKVDEFLSNITKQTNLKTFRILGNVFIMVLIFDAFITGYALRAFYVRVSNEYDLNVNDRANVNKEYNNIYSDMRLSGIIYKYFDDEKMLKTFPNLKIEDANKNMIYVEGLLEDIQPYYFRVGKK